MLCVRSTRSILASKMVVEQRNRYRLELSGCGLMDGDVWITHHVEER